jgi:hypothetical protein
MKKLFVSTIVFIVTSFSGAFVAFASYPPGGDNGVTETLPPLPETGASASLISDASQYGSVALILGLGLVGAFAVRRRSLQS